MNKNYRSKNCWKMSEGTCGLKVPVCNEMDLLTEVEFRRRKFVNHNNRIYTDFCGALNTELL